MSVPEFFQIVIMEPERYIRRVEPPGNYREKTLRFRVVLIGEGIWGPKAANLLELLRRQFFPGA